MAKADSLRNFIHSLLAIPSSQLTVPMGTAAMELHSGDAGRGGGDDRVESVENEASGGRNRVGRLKSARRGRREREKEVLYGNVKDKRRIKKDGEAN